MAKKVAVLAVDPVNGYGLFNYLESFYENEIPFKVFAVAPTKNIHTNSGVAITADDTIAALKGNEDEFDALVFSCGDAVPKFADNASAQHNVDLFEVIANFAKSGKLMIGHCAAAMMFDMAGITQGRKLAVHPLAKAAISTGEATDAKFEIDGQFATAQQEHTVADMMPSVIELLK